VEVKKDILWRVYMCFIAIAIICIIIFSKAFIYSRCKANTGEASAIACTKKIQEIDAERGTIYSDDGQMLSTSIPQFDIYIDFKADGLRANNGKLFKKNIDSLSYQLSLLFKDKSKQEYKNLLAQGYKNRKPLFHAKKKSNL